MPKIVLNFTDERSRWAITPAAQQKIRNALPNDWELKVIGAPVSSRGDGSGVSDELLAAAPGTEEARAAQQALEGVKSAHPDLDKK